VVSDPGGLFHAREVAVGLDHEMTVLVLDVAEGQAAAPSRCAFIGGE